jgi:hypothetical protein
MVGFLEGEDSLQKNSAWRIASAATRDETRAEAFHLKRAFGNPPYWDEGLPIRPKT